MTSTVSGPREDRGGQRVNGGRSAGGLRDVIDRCTQVMGQGRTRPVTDGDLMGTGGARGSRPGRGMLDTRVSSVFLGPCSAQTSTTRVRVSEGPGTTRFYLPSSGGVDGYRDVLTRDVCGGGS